MIFLDLAKAFDTVPHASILQALERNRVPSCLQKCVMSMYRNASTIFQQNGKSTRSIRIQSGVKQGCPLSPLLFNLVMDELVNKIQRHSQHAGITVEGIRIPIMAFADDLVLLSDNKHDMDFLLDQAKTFFDGHELAINVRKCLGLRVTPVKDKQSMRVETQPFFRWPGAELIPSMGFGDLMKYLGVEFNHRGEIIFPINTFTGWCDKIAKARLKPAQKVSILVEVLIPKMLHIMRLGEFGIGKVRALDKLLRTAYKRYLHLPDYTPTAWIHSPTGGRLTKMEVLLTNARLNAATKMTLSEDDEAARRVGILALNEAERFQEITRLLGDSKAERKRRFAARCIEEQRRKVLNGKSTAAAMGSAVKKSWLWRSLSFPSYALCFAVQALSGTLKTRIQLSVGTNDPALKMCRRCKKTAETPLHVLAECSYSKKHFTRRHNCIVQYIAKALGDTSDLILTERSIALAPMMIVKPDIVAWQPHRNLVLDVSSPYENSEEKLDRTLGVKDLKYLEVGNPHIRSLNPAHIDRPVLRSGIVVGAMGTITALMRDRFKLLGLTKRHMTVLQMIALRESANTWFHFIGSHKKATGA